MSPSGKPLADAEPRIAVTGATAPGDAGAAFVISQPGSRGLAGNVGVPNNTTSVRIAASWASMAFCTRSLEDGGGGPAAEKAPPRRGEEAAGSLP